MQVKVTIATESETAASSIKSNIDQDSTMYTTIFTKFKNKAVAAGGQYWLLFTLESL